MSKQQDGGGGWSIADLSGSEQSYWQRVRRIAEMMDLRNAFISASTIAAARATMERARGSAAATAEAEVDGARRVLEATTHPDTGETVLLPLRLSMVVPVNVTLDALMIAASSSQQPWAIAAAQVLNQVYNACHYAANANQSNRESGAVRALAFALATASSTAVALAINRYAPHGAGGALLSWSRLAPFCAVASADVLNVATIRSNEWRNGIVVYDERTGQPLPQPSRRAGAVAVAQCTVSRVTAAMAPLLVPPLLLAALQRRPHSFVNRLPFLRLPFLLCTLAAAIQIGVPLTFGVFKQRGELAASLLEPHVQQQSPTVERVVYNKGL